MKTTTLRAMCELISDQVSPRSDSDSLYIGLEHIKSARFHRIGGGRESEVESGKFAFRKGDVLYGKLRPYLDKAIVAEADGICTTELLVLRPKKGVSAKFLVSLLHSPSFVEHAMSGVTGVQHPRTSWQRIAEFEFPNFSGPERDQIASLLWLAQDAITLNESVEAELAALKRAAMRELFARGLRGEAQKETEIGPIPESWEVIPLGSIARLERGRFLHRPRNEPRFYGGATPFIQTGDVVRSAGRIREFTQTLNDEGVAISRVFPAGTILITIAANIGFTGTLSMDAACPDSLIGITPSPNVNVEFLEYFLQTQQPEMDRQAPKGTQKNINIQFLTPWPCVVPGLDEQHEIVAILGSIDRKITLHKEKRAVLEALFKSLLHKLMTGEVRAADLNLDALGSAAEAA